MNNNCKFFFIIVIILFFSCNSENLLHDLSQKQAIEIVSLLNANKIEAAVEKGRGQNSFIVKVSSSSYHEAMSLLKKNDLPKEEQISYRELISKRSLLHNSRDIDAIRLDRALAIEIEETLMGISSVKDAKVIVRKKFIDDNETEGIAVVLNIYANTPFKIESVKEIIKNVVPGITAERTSITVNKVLPDVVISDKGNTSNNEPNAQKLSPFLMWELPEKYASQIILSTIAFIVLSLVVGLIFGYSFASVSNKKSESLDYLPDPEIMSLNFDDNEQSQDESKGN